MAQDEWRVEVDLDDPEHGFTLSERLRAIDLDDEVADRLGERVIVTRDGPRLFVYTQTAEAAIEAERVVRSAVEADRLSAAIARSRWNPDERDWQDAGGPLAETPEPDEDQGDEDEGVQYPLFVFIEGHEPRFMRDLGF